MEKIEIPPELKGWREMTEKELGQAVSDANPRFRLHLFCLLTQTETSVPFLLEKMEKGDPDYCFKN
jgi:hypothetical protein